MTNLPAMIFRPQAVDRQTWCSTPHAVGDSCLTTSHSPTGLPASPAAVSPAKRRRSAGFIAWPPCNRAALHCNRHLGCLTSAAKFFPSAVTWSQVLAPFKAMDLPSPSHRLKSRRSDLCASLPRRWVGRPAEPSCCMLMMHISSCSPVRSQQRIK